MTSTLTTPVAGLVLTRTVTPRAVAIELRDEAGRPLYAEEIATRPADASPDEPDTPEQQLPR